MSIANVLLEVFAAGGRFDYADPGNAGTISIDRSPCNVTLNSAGAETRTLAAPTRRGAIVTLAMRTNGGNIVVTVTGGFNETGDTTFTFSDSGQFATFVSVETAADTFVWRLMSHYGLGNLSPTEVAALNGQTLTTGAAAGITGGTGTVFEQSRAQVGNIFKTTIFIDLTGLGTSTTDLDIIGQGVSAAYICKLTALETGATIDAILVTCLEAPATGQTDIDLYSAVEGTGKFDDLVTGLTETALLTSGGAWTNGRQLGATVCPTAEEYLYLTNGAGATVGTYTAGKFLIEIYGH